jgi:hypothetical protein
LLELIFFTVIGNVTAIRIETLEKRFRELCKRTLLKLTEKRVQLQVDEFFNSLTMLPIAFRKEYESTIQRILLATAEDSINPSVVSARHFRQLGPLLIFIDYGLLKHIISDFGDAVLKEDMSKYVDDIKVFMKETRVGDLMEHWPGHEIPKLNRMYSKLIAKFKGGPQTYTLENVDGFRRRLCSYVRLSKFVCGLISFEPSESFFAVWIIPTAIAPQLTEAISKIDEVFFQKEHILAVAVQLYQSGEDKTSSTCIVRKEFNFDKSQPTLKL